MAMAEARIVPSPPAGESHGALTRGPHSLLGAHKPFYLRLSPRKRRLHCLAPQITHRHLGHNALRKDLRRDLGRCRSPRNRQDLVVVRIGIVVERALRRPFLSPGLQRREFRKGRQVEAAARRYKLLDGRWLREMHKQALGGLLVLAEVPNAPEERQARREAPFRP